MTLRVYYQHLSRTHSAESLVWRVDEQWDTYGQEVTELHKFQKEGGKARKGINTK